MNWNSKIYTIEQASIVFKRVLGDLEGVEYLETQIPLLYSETETYNLSVVGETTDEGGILEWIVKILNQQNVWGETLLTYSDNDDNGLPVHFHTPFARVKITGDQWIMPLWGKGRSLGFRSLETEDFWLLRISGSYSYPPNKFYVNANLVTIKTEI